MRWTCDAPPVSRCTESPLALGRDSRRTPRTLSASENCFERCLHPVGRGLLHCADDRRNGLSRTETRDEVQVIFNATYGHSQEPQVSRCARDVRVQASADLGIEKWISVPRGE